VVIVQKIIRENGVEADADNAPNGKIPGDFAIYMNMTGVTAESEAEILIPIQLKGAKN